MDMRALTYILPIERQIKETQALVVGSTTEEVSQCCGLGPGRMHGGQARN